MTPCRQNTEEKMTIHVVNENIAWGGIMPAGTYTVGGDKDARNGFETRQVVIERPFQLARYPVTNAQFQRFVEAADFADSRWWEGMPAKAKKLSEPAFPFWNHPRERVSWYQAIAFCRWLSHKLGYEVDLPHEYEWEVAARYPDDRFYPWGNDFDGKKANTWESGIRQTTQWAAFQAGRNPALDLYDLSGNVWEWCRNQYDNQMDTAVDAGETLRVVRGGSWFSVHNDARLSTRYSAFPGHRSPKLGFRVWRRSRGRPAGKQGEEMMKQVGLRKIWNATPHVITFWLPGWDEPVEVAPDEVINAIPIETAWAQDGMIDLVNTRFIGNDAGREVIRRARAAGAEIIVGSIIAAQAYPGEVYAMVPAPGYERVAAPAPKDLVNALRGLADYAASQGIDTSSEYEVLARFEEAPTKRMRPDKFTVFQD